MSEKEIGERLKKARIHAGYTSAADAASALGMKYPTYAGHENGNRGVVRAAEIYARRFHVSLDWLLRNRGPGPGDVIEQPVVGTKRVPVLSMVSASNLRDQDGINREDIDRWINVSDLPTEGDWIALQVDGDSMDRVAPDGSTILVNRSDATLLDGRFYVFALENGAATFKQYRRSPERLQPYSTNPEHYSIPANDSIFVVGRVRRVIHDL